jgi:hypothetical protein
MLVSALAQEPSLHGAEIALLVLLSVLELDAVDGDLLATVGLVKSFNSGGISISCASLVPLPYPRTIISWYMTLRRDAGAGSIDGAMTRVFTFSTDFLRLPEREKALDKLALRVGIGGCPDLMESGSEPSRWVRAR